MKEVGIFFKNKTILVTGGAGSIGSELVRKLLQLEPRVVRVLDNNETGLFELQQELQSEKMRTFIGDIRDKERLKIALDSVNIVFHAAALKHVPLCEYNPFEAVKTNVIGTQNLIEASMEENVDKLVTISTDKAVNPINVVGATKLLAERLTISANHYKGKRKIDFCCVRFGNVLDSRGSIIPVVKDQIEKGGPVTITDTNMTRFVMSIPQAVELILKAAKIAKGGEIFILKMPALRISALVEVMIEEFAPKYGYKPEKIKMGIIGKRAGEKIYEELITENEEENAYMLDDMLIVLPQKIKEKNNDGRLVRGGLSKNVKFLSKKQIKQMLKEI